MNIQMFMFTNFKNNQSQKKLIVQNISPTKKSANILYCMKRGMKHQNVPYLSAVNVQKLKLRRDIILRLCHKPYTGIYKQQ